MYAALLTFSSQAITTIKIPRLSETPKAYAKAQTLEQESDFVNFIAGYLKNATSRAETIPKSDFKLPDEEKIYSSQSSGSDEGQKFGFRVNNKTKQSGQYVSNYIIDVDFELLSPIQLHKDAKAINSFPSHVTVLCVALKDNKHCIKKFVFCNSNRAIPQAMEDKAKLLGYHAVIAEQAHAEGQLIQFLAKRQEVYTHVVAMGCDKDHCPDCHALLQLVFGNDYTKVSYNRPRSNYAPNYYIPRNLKAIIESLTMCKITLVGDRYLRGAAAVSRPLSPEENQIQQAARKRLRSNPDWSPFEGDINRKKNKRIQENQQS